MPKFLPSVLSFAVPGLRWLSNIQLRSPEESCRRKYGEWWLVHHLLITCVPFTTKDVGCCVDFAPSIRLYSGNTIFISAMSFRLLALTPSFERTGHPPRLLSMQAKRSNLRGGTGTLRSLRQGVASLRAMTEGRALPA